MSIRIPISVKIGSHVFSTRIMNAGGTIKDMPRLMNYVKCPDTGAVEFGSYTMPALDGNPGHPFYPDPRGLYLNSIGLTNGGKKFIDEHFRELAEVAYAYNKIVIGNCAPLKDPSEAVELTLAFFENGADISNVNLGCPNVWNKGEQKIILSFLPKKIRELLQLFAKDKRIHQYLSQGKQIWLKFSPLLEDYSPNTIYEISQEGDHYPNFKISQERVEEVVSIINEFDGLVSAIAGPNTIPNCRIVDMEAIPRTINNPEGVGGLSGTPALTVNLEQTILFRKHSKLPLVVSGGVQSGADMLLCLEVGASIVQIGGPYYHREDPGIFSAFLSEISFSE